VGTILFIFGVILFVALVVLHEFGHAIAAWQSGVEVEEFGIGFPPRAWAKKLKNGTLFSLNWLPIGGFVKLKGEHDSATGKGTYGGASLLTKTKILLAGVVVNWVTAAVIFTVLALVGMPQILPNQFSVAGDTVVTTKAVRAGSVVKDSPAAKVGVVVGDSILQIAGENVVGADQFKSLTKKNAGQTVPLVYEHQNGDKTERITKDVALNKDNSGGKGYIGLGAAEEATQRSTWSAPIVGVGVTAQFTYETFAGLGRTIANLFSAHFAEAGESVTGPVGIISILSSSAQGGIVPVLFLIGIISLTLAVMNVLPIPALDGGRLFVTLIFRALKKPLTKEREESIQAAGMIALLGLVLLITVLDVKRFF
jgi:regulator of sigma E protease